MECKFMFCKLKKYNKEIITVWFERKIYLKIISKKK